ncbi:MAG: hypothetical protein HY647_00030 [Acidobacteria bacterium]|nr:hypothetical protein [Acidobacteriota bacterium]
MNTCCASQQFRTVGHRRSTRLVLILAALCVKTPPARAGTSSPLLSPEKVLTRMEERLEQQYTVLESYQARRRYSASHPLLGDSVYLLVKEHYRSPDEKDFQVLESGGPAAIQKRLFSRLLEAELDTAPEVARQAVDICRRNYRFTFQKYDAAAGAYVFHVEPRTSNPYLLRGKIWVNAEDFGVQRIEGEPAQRHSSLVRQTHFVHDFARFGPFWFPVRHHSEAELFLFGHATLEITYYDYNWSPRQEVLP